MPGEIFQRLHKRLQALEATRIRVEILHNDGRLRKRDIESVYEGLFLRAVTAYESFLEDLFFRIVLGRARYPKTRVALRVSIRSASVLRPLIIPTNRQYIDWLPIERTQELANRFIRGGRPFSELDRGDTDLLKKVVLTRHAIAHSSKYAQTKFRQTVVGAANLLPNEKTPAGFLRAVVTTAPLRRQYEVYSAELARIGATLV